MVVLCPQLNLNYTNFIFSIVMHAFCGLWLQYSGYVFEIQLLMFLFFLCSYSLRILYPGGYLHQQQCAHFLGAVYRDGLPCARGHHLWSGHLPQQPLYWTSAVLSYILLHRYCNIYSICFCTAKISWVNRSDTQSALWVYVHGLHECNRF